MVAWLYGNYREIMRNLRVIIFVVISAFIFGYTLTIGGGEAGLPGLLMWLMAMSLLASVLAVLMRFLIREIWYPKILIGIGGVVILISLVSYYFTFGLIFTETMDFIVHEMGYLSKSEAFYRYYFTWLIRISALLTYGFFLATIGYSLWRKNQDRYNSAIKVEAYVFLFFVSIEIIHSFIFGSRIMI